MPRDVIITPASGLVDFKDDLGNIDAKLQIDLTGNLSLTNTGGNLIIGDSSATVYIGDGTNTTNIIFEQSGAIYGLSGKTLTLGAANSLVTIASATSATSTLGVTGLITAAGGVTVSGGSLNISGTADTSTASSHYFVETASDSIIRPKTLANVKTEILGNTNITFAGPTAARTYTLPDASVTLAALSVANSFSATQTIIADNQLLLKNGATSNPTLIVRNDGSSFYLLLSDAGTTASGTWNALRPFIINAYSGLLSSSNGQSFSGGLTTSSQITSTVAIGTAPFVVTSTTRVANLNVATAGNADTATILQTARNINGVSFNGSADVTVTTAGTGITVTGTTVAIDNTVATLTGTQTLSNKFLTDDSTIFQNYSDNTRRAYFSLLGISPNSIRIMTLPDQSTTLVGRSTTDTLSNKSLTSFDQKTGSTTIANQAVVQATVATTAQTAVDTFSASTYRSAKYIVQITQGTNYQSSEIMVLHNGTTTSTAEYAMMNTGGTLGTFSSDINGGNVRLLVTMASGASATINISRTTIVV